MKITHDRDANALYIRLSEGTFGHTQVINENVLLNIDNQGQLMGVELLGVSHWVDEPTQAQVVDITRPRAPQGPRKPVTVLSEDLTN
jgi:uncharacterized protein YuzE